MQYNISSNSQNNPTKNILVSSISTDGKTKTQKINLHKVTQTVMGDQEIKYRYPDSNSSVLSTDDQTDVSSQPHQIKGGKLEYYIYTNK